jgi:hypothetical protein
MNEMYNPDYPVANSGSFMDHTYLQPEQNMNMFWYSGAPQMPFGGQPGYYPDSRRNEGAQNYPNQPQSQVPLPSMLQQPPVLPFSSYPVNNQPAMNVPATNVQPGFNSLVESRRFDNQPASTGINPWATQTAVPATPTPQPFTPPVTPQPQIPNPWTYQPQYNSYMDPNCAALYCQHNFSFDKTNAWDNVYTRPRPVEPPTINWNQQGYQNQPSYVQTTTYPAFNCNANRTQVSWMDIADQNWGKGNF